MAVSLAAKLEAILYLKGKPLRLGELAVYAQSSKTAVEDAIIDLMENYAERDCALEITQTSEGYLLQLKPALKELVHTLVPVDLGVGVLRSLAAIALKNGISLSDLVELRGSGAYQHVQKLVTEGFVQKRQHKDSRSAKLRVTEKFHQYFQIEQLPEVKVPQLTPKAVQLRLEEALLQEDYEAEVEALEQAGTLGAEGSEAETGQAETE
jgi:segregation and condensation protein B